MESQILNICQVSLVRNISLIEKNYLNFSKFYNKFHLYIICPQKDLILFKEKFKNHNITIVNEDDILSFKDFKNIFLNLSKAIKYQKEFENRLGWYYQQMLKITFVIDFIDNKRESIVIWDADTIILRKINFFSNFNSNSFASLFEFHKAYYITTKNILGILPSYFVSSLIQFIAVDIENNFNLKNKLNNYMKKNLFQTSEWVSNIIFKSIFESHVEYNGSMFSEYELIGISNLLSKKRKQKALFTLRFGLNGMLTDGQLLICKLLNVYHVTYEHSHPNKNSQGMLNRNQSWLIFIKIILKDLIKFNLRNIKHFFYYLIK